MIGVLIVDDDFMVARVHAGYVARTAEFEVIGMAHTGAAALTAIAERRPELVLLDLYLPDIPGLEVLRLLRQDGAVETDVIVVSAADDVDSVRGAMRGGALQYLIKPFSYDALHDQLRHFAEVRARLRGLSRVGQADIDRVFRSRHGDTSTLPKGLTPETARLIARVLRECDDDMSAAECAAAAALSRASARRYLEYFVSTGQAQVRLRYGGAGRPERRYRPG